MCYFKTINKTKCMCVCVCLFVTLFLKNCMLDLDQTWHVSWYWPQSGFRPGGVPGKNQVWELNAKIWEKMPKNSISGRRRPLIKKVYKIKVAQHPRKHGYGWGQNWPRRSLEVKIEVDGFQAFFTRATPGYPMLVTDKKVVYSNISCRLRYGLWKGRGGAYFIELL